MTQDRMEQFATARLVGLGYAYQHGPGRSHGGVHTPRAYAKRLLPHSSVLRGVLVLVFQVALSVALLSQCTANAPWAGTNQCPGPITLNTSYSADVDSVHWSWTPATATMVNANVFDPVFIPDPLTTDQPYTLTVQLFDNGVACVPPSSSFVLTILQVTSPGLSAIYNGSSLGPVNTYGPDFPVFAVCDDPPPSNATIDFTDSSIGGPPAPGAIDWGNGSVLAVPCSQTYSQALDTITYTTTDPQSGCTMTSQFGVLLGGPVELDVSINLTGSLEQCLDDLTTVEIIDPNPFNPANPAGTMYVITYGNGALGFDTIFGTLPAQADFPFPALSCGEFLAPPYNGNGYTVNVYPYYGCPVTNVVTVNSDAPVYVSEPPVADVSVSPLGPYCTNENIVFTDQSSGQWIDYVPPFTANCEDPLIHWGLTGVQGTDWNLVSGSLGDVGTPGSSSIEVEYLVPGNYVVTIYAQGNPLCGIDEEAVAICVEAPPLQPLFSAGPLSGCAPLSVVLDNQSPEQFGCTGGYQWSAQWNGPPSACATSGDADFTNDGPQSYEPDLTLNEAGVYTVSLVATNSCGNSAPFTVDVAVAEPPVVILSPLPASVCEGALVDPAATVDSCGAAIISYNWNFSNADPSTSSLADPDPITVLDPNVPLIIQLIANNGCIGEVVTVQADVLELGGTMTVIADPSPVCLDGTVTLTVTDGPIDESYTWTRPNGSTEPASETSILVLAGVSANEAGIWNVTAGDSECAAVGQVEVVLHPQPQVSIDPVAPICPGTSVILQANANGAVGDFVWGDGSVGAIYTTPMLNTTIDFEVCFTDASTGCEECAPIAVEVLDAVVAEAGPPTLELCDQAIEVPLNGAPAGGAWTITNGGPGTLTEVASVWTFTPNGQGTTTLVYEVDFGDDCSDSDETTVTIGPVIPADPGPLVEVCVSDDAFNMPNIGGGVWTDELPYFVGGVFNPALAGVDTFTVNYCLAPGTTCEDCATVDVIVNGLPDVGPFTDVVICQGQPAFALPGPGSGWSTFPNVLSNGVFNPIIANSYTPCFTAVDPLSGCEASLCLNVLVEPTPTAQFVANPDTACQQVPVEFTDLSTAGSGGILSGWSWDFGDPNSDTDVSDVTNPEYVYALAGTYEVELIVAQGNCSDTIASNVVVQAPPTAAFTLEDDTVCSNVPVVFTNTSIGTITSYVWAAEGWSITDAVPPPTPFPAPVCDSATVVITLTVDNESVYPAAQAERYSSTRNHWAILCSWRIPSAPGPLWPCRRTTPAHRNGWTPP
ncbi:MAG: PKD domain-containing protein [Flavobacteriales bacterium]|nr:PKD domain-containing protein [Flavobacteriales bacterium]